MVINEYLSKTAAKRKCKMVHETNELEPLIKTIWPRFFLNVKFDSARLSSSTFQVQSRYCPSFLTFKRCSSCL